MIYVLRRDYHRFKMFKPKKLRKNAPNISENFSVLEKKRTHHRQDEVISADVFETSMKIIGR